MADDTSEVVYGFSSKGFFPKRQADIIESINTNLATIQDENTGEYPFQNASDDTILQQIVAVFASELAICWGAATDAYNQFDPLYNSGAGQSATVQLNGLERKPGSKTIVTIICKGNAGVIIPKGSLITTLEGILIFEVDSNILLDSNGEGNGTASNIEMGAVEVENNTLNFIKTSVAGWNSVTNIATVQHGSDVETDAMLRIRQQQSTEMTSYRQIGAIWTGIEQVNGVEYCRVYVNATLETDDRGIPAKEIAPVVVGGDDDEITEQIWIKAPITIEGYGNTHVTKYDLQGFPHVISFTRPAQINIIVDIHVEITNATDFSPNYEEEIKNAILNYVKYDANGGGFPPGEDVYVSRLYTPVNEQLGFKVNILRVAKEDSPDEWTSDFIEIKWDEVAIFTSDNILITQDIPE